MDEDYIPFEGDEEVEGLDFTTDYTNIPLMED